MNWQPPARTNYNYIRTISGKKFWPLNPRPEDVDIKDIAHALSLRCRYNCHLPYLYSVCQHSLNVYYHSGLLWGLLHDATEAYLPDVPKPIKEELPFFREIEWQLHKVIAQYAGLDADGVHLVKWADTEVLQWEYRHFRPQVAGEDAIKHVGHVPGIMTFEEAQPDIDSEEFLREYRKIQCGKS